jgi:hypothetical protein
MVITLILQKLYSSVFHNYLQGIKMADTIVESSLIIIMTFFG